MAGYFPHTTLLGLALLVIGFAAAPAASQDRSAELPGGRRLHLSCSGFGLPTVLLESGLGLPMLAWSKVKAQLEPNLRVCSYERAGYGTSDPGPMPRDARHIVDDLAELLSVEKIPGPYVLVGHSLGSHYVRLFAAERPAEVLGLVLVDPIFEENDRKLSSASPAVKAFLDEEKAMLERCIGAVAQGQLWKSGQAGYERCGPSPPPGSVMARPEMAQATLSEFESREISAAQVRAATRRPLNVPLIVLTATGKRAPELSGAQAVTMREHAAIAETSDQGVHRQVADSGHVIQFDRPEAVTQAVRDILSLSRLSRQGEASEDR